MEHGGLRYSLKIRLRASETFFGPGLAELLLLVGESHSLNVAAHTMGMAYSKAWRIVKAAEAELRYPLLERKVGGVDGGGSEVTPRGRDLITRYQAFAAALAEEADRLFDRYFSGLDQTTEGETDGNRSETAAQTAAAASGGQPVHPAGDP
ncbi:LysR family transcriptional regulator [Butyricicoccus faecihominis]|uniref:winged helix-turn-helix domain-containing protein n=1 Tax=Butyricicoccus faecihominis TaxID=1712515 RepID=UPI0024786CD1|nr:LysR family transcriptional regulator [Butyricicoccus faecihominis]MCQ5130051.1 LysR family transcriptional regulator [Butyricicoccus faecihominis]